MSVRMPEVPKGGNSLSSLPAELQLGIVRHLPRTSLAAICRLNKHWRPIGTDELLRRLLPIPLRETDCDNLLGQAIHHFIYTNNADALQALLDFRPQHPYLHPPTGPLLLAEPASLRARVTKDEEERFCLASTWTFDSHSVDSAFKYNDMSCIQLLIDHGLVDYSRLLDRALHDGFSYCFGYGNLDSRNGATAFARPTPGPDSRGGHNSVLDWLLAYPPRHVVQALLLMWGRLWLHLRLQPLGNWSDWESRKQSQSCDNMLILAAASGHPASLQTIDELRMMVEILADDASGGVIPAARQPLSHALLFARGMASMWPGTPPLVAEYLQSVCLWEDHQNSSSDGNNPNNPPSLPAPLLILPPVDPVLHRLIDLKTYDEMLEPENWLQLESRVQGGRPLLWLVATEFLTDEEAALRMRCYKRALRLLSDQDFTLTLLQGASTFRRWRCVEVVLGELRGMWPSQSLRSERLDWVLCRAILDAVHGEPGCADGRIIRKLLRTGARNLEDFKCFRVGEDVGPFRGGWFGWEPFRLAFVQWQQDREQRETAACMEMRDAILDSLSISDQKALNFLIGEPSKALYRASTRRRLQRLADKRERGKGAGGAGEGCCGESSCSSTTNSSSSGKGYP